MELKNFERELKYYITGPITFESVLRFLNDNDYLLVETKNKKKDEIYYDTSSLLLIKRGDVIRSTTHYNPNGTYSHYMYKKNASNPHKPYVSKYEFGSGIYGSISDFIHECDAGFSEELNVVLRATIVRETCVVQKGPYKLLISFDRTFYKKDDITLDPDMMLEIEDWTTPYTLEAENSTYDEHLLAINDLILSCHYLHLKSTKESKPLRGLKLLDCVLLR